MIHYMCVFSLPRIQHQLQDNARIRVRAREKTHGIMDQLSKAHLESSTCHRLPSKFLSLFFLMRFQKKKKNRNSTLHRSVQHKVICPHVLAQKTRVYERVHIRTHNAAVHQGSRSKVPMQDNKYLSLSLHFPKVVVASVLPFPFFFLPLTTVL